MSEDDQRESGGQPRSGKRRRALKSILSTAGVAVGTQALPDQWFRPAVSSIVMPVHAQTSPPTSGFECSLDAAVFPGGNGSPNSFTAQVVTEADDGTRAVFTLVDPDSGEFNNGDGDFTLTTDVVQGVAFVEDGVAGEFTSPENSTEMQVNVDIDADDVDDCGTEIGVATGAGP